MVQGQLTAVLHHLRALAGEADSGAVGDGPLLQRFASGQDEAAFEALVRRHGPLVWDVCRNVLRHAQDAEDAFQATFLVLARRASSIRKQGSVASWLYGVAYRVAAKARADATRRQAHQRRVANMAKVDAGLDMDDDVRALVHEELQQVPQKYRAAVVLFYLEGKSYEACARLLGCPVGTIKSRLARGRQLLRVRLLRRGLTLSAGWAGAALAPAPASALPAALVATTARAALLVAAGKAAAISAQALAWADGAVKALTATRLGATTAFLLAFGLLGVGAGLMARTEAPPRPEPARDVDGRAAGTVPVRAGHRSDPLPAGALMRLGDLRFRAGDRIDGVAFSPAGKTLAVATSWTLGLWDLATGKETRRIVDHTVNLGSVAFSPDGKRVAAPCYNEQVVRLWDTATGKEQRVFSGHQGHVWKVAFSPAGKTLASAADDLTIRLWDTATGKQRHCLKGHDGSNFANSIFAIAFSPDGKLLASAGADRTVRLWDTATGKELHRMHGARLDGSRGWIGSVAFSPDGRTLASGHGDGTIHLWDPATGKERCQLAGSDDLLSWSVAFSPDGKTLYSGGTDGTIRYWDVATGQERRRIRSGWGGSSLALAPDGKTLVSWGGTNTVRLWDVATGKECFPHAGHQAGVLRLRPSADGQSLISWGRDGTVRRWDLAAGMDRWVAASSHWWCDDGGVALSRDGKLLAIGGFEKLVLLWDTASGKQRHRLAGHTKPVTAVALRSDGKILASTGYDQTLRFWDVDAGKELRRVPAPDPELGSLTFSPDGRLLACAGKARTVCLLDADSGKHRLRIKAHPDQRAPGVQDLPSVVRFSPDGKLLATARSTDPAIRLWDVTTGKEVRQLKQPAIPPLFMGNFTLAFSPDGHALAGSWARGIVRVWELRSGEEVCRFDGHRNEVRALAFSADGKVLFSGSDDSTILAWDVTGRDTAEKPVALEALWNDLAGDAPRAYRALWALARDRRAVPFLKVRLRPIRAGDARRIGRLLADLDGDTFAVREQAARELETLGAAAKPALRRALAGRPTPEVRRRVQQLLARITAPSGVRLRLLRAVEVLEHAARPEARELLEALAAGAPEADLTRAARTALDHLLTSAPR